MKRQNPYTSTPKRYLTKPKQMVLYKRPVQRLAPQEQNYFDSAFSGNYDTTGSIALIATIAQGPTASNRIGKKCILRNLTIRGFSYSNTNTLMSDCALLIIYDENPSGALPAITDILTSVSSAAFMNTANSTRFKVLKRKDFICIGNYSAPTTGQEAHNEDAYMRINKEIVFKNLGTGAIADIQKGAIYCVTVGGAAPGNTAPVTNLAFRTRFTEQ